MGKVLLVDDDVELAELLREYIEQEGYPTTVVHDGESGVAAALEGDFSLIVLDVMLPGINGIDVLRRIRAQSRVPIIMLTAKGDDLDRIVGLEMGADDYVPKPCMPRELTARIRAILRRAEPAPDLGNANSRRIIKAGGLSLWPEKRSVEWQGQALEVTSTEFNLLSMLAREVGKVVSKSDLSQHALGRPLARFDRSIDVHINSIRHKLGLREDGRSWIQTVRGVGYQLSRD